MTTKLKLSDEQVLEIIQGIGPAQWDTIMKKLSLNRFLESTKDVDSDLSLEEIQQLVDEVRHSGQANPEKT